MNVGIKLVFQAGNGPAEKKSEKKSSKPHDKPVTNMSTAESQPMVGKTGYVSGKSSHPQDKLMRSQTNILESDPATPPGLVSRNGTLHISPWLIAQIIETFVKLSSHITDANKANRLDDTLSARLTLISKKCARVTWYIRSIPNEASEDQFLLFLGRSALVCQSWSQDEKEDLGFHLSGAIRTYEAELSKLQKSKKNRVDVQKELDELVLLVNSI